MQAKILVVDDESDALDLLQVYLERAGYRVVTATTGIEAIRKIGLTLPDLIVLDWMLPGMDGLELCKQLRRAQATATLPIIMLSAKASEMDRIVALEVGADDYMTKPFSPRELVLRIQKRLKPKSHPASLTDKLEFEGLCMNLEARTLTLNGKPLDLTRTEFDLLKTLMERVDRVQSREQLLTDVWRYESGADSRTVDTHVRRLRKKLGPLASWIKTVRGFGYCLRTGRPIKQVSKSKPFTKT